MNACITLDDVILSEREKKNVIEKENLSFQFGLDFFVKYPEYRDFILICTDKIIKYLYLLFSCKVSNLAVMIVYAKTYLRSTIWYLHFDFVCVLSYIYNISLIKCLHFGYT